VPVEAARPVSFRKFRREVSGLVFIDSPVLSRKKLLSQFDSLRTKVLDALVGYPADFLFGAVRVALLEDHDTGQIPGV